MATHILGIRHHGPGSAKNVKAFLEQLKPDIVLVEGPPDADGILQWANHAALKPPVAILCYQPDNPQQSVFYPFAEFSPEWQAILYAKQNNIHVRFMDLPSANQFAIEAEKRKEAEQNENDITDQENKTEDNDIVPINNAVLFNKDIRYKSATPMKLHSSSQSPVHKKSISSAGAEEIAGEEIEIIRLDPVGYLAEAAGYGDGEKWWEHTFEHRQNDEAVFEAVQEAMQALRESLPAKDDKLEQCREAHMRKTIRQAEKEMFQNIAVICGAWHAPALMNMPKQKDDNDSA